MMNELKMTEIKTLSWTELEMLVNDLKKKHTNKGLTDVETKILRGIFDDKKYADLAEEIRQEEQSIKNAAHKLWKILSEQMGEKIDSNNLITALARYRDNSQTFDHNNKPQTQQSDKVFELVIEVGIDDLTPEKIDKINNLIQKIARDNTIKPIMKLKGSIRLFLEGSEDGLQRLADLHQSRELQALLNELKSDDIPEIIVKKGKFTTDAKVIEKAELIKAIREGTIDKTTLRFVDLSGANLSGANLSGAILSGANLKGADLRRAFLSEADLSGADLRGAILSEADLSGADLRGAKLWGANLSGAIKVLELVIEVGIDDLTPEKIDKINNLIQKIARDETIKPIMKPKGSIRLFLEGSEDGLQRLADLHQSRELQALLNELKSDDIPEIIVKKGKFTTDAKVIEKAELIKAIREGTIDKTTLRFVDLSGANLSGANLSGAILSGANLKGADLRRAFLSGANLKGADLRRAFLSEADLSGADLRGAKLWGANLKGADLRRAFLSEADLSGADLRGAKLWGANLSGAIKVLELVIEVGIDDLTPEKIDKINNLIQKIARDETIKPIMKPKGSIRLFLEGSEDGLQRLADLHQSGELQALLNELKSDDIPEIIVKKAEFTTDAKVIEKDELIKAIREGTIDKTTLRFVDLSGAILIGAILSEANLRGANLSDANLSDANLRWANLRWANLRGANLSGAILIEANLSAANLSGADLRKANLSDAILIEANLSKANLSGAKLREADLRKANLSEANLSEANLIGAILREAKLIEADLSEANLSGADVKNAIFIGATGITREQKQDLIRRGAIFGDTSNDRSKVLV
jgi:uncharacterized protein YjbI with pentapeptide repeats